MAFAIDSIPSNMSTSSMPHDFGFGKAWALNIMVTKWLYVIIRKQERCNTKIGDV